MLNLHLTIIFYFSLDLLIFTSFPVRDTFKIPGLIDKVPGKMNMS